MKELKGKKIVLIDGHSILNRAFFGIPDLTNSEGLHTNAVYGFLNIMFKILDEEKPEYLTVAFDRSEPTFRHDMFKEYKGTRKPMADELRQQVPVMKEMLQAMGIKTIDKAGLEADDILGTISVMAESEGMEVRVVSGDRDLLQLATEHTMIRIPKTKRTGTEIENYFAKDVLEKYQVTPKEFIDLKALMGDSSDNIPGVPGIGEKTATTIIATYKSIEGAHEHLDEIKPNRAKQNLEEFWDQAVMSKILATIEVHADIDYDINDAEIKDLFTEEAYNLCKRLELKSILTRFDVTPTGSVDESAFKVLLDFNEIDDYIRNISSKRIAVNAVVIDGELFGISMGEDISGNVEERCVFIPVWGFVTEQYLIDLTKKVCDQAEAVASFDIKQLIKLGITRDYSKCIDITVGAYLLDPVRNTYEYDEVMNILTGRIIPSEADILGKTKIKAAVDECPDKLYLIGNYKTYSTLLTMDQLEDKLKAENMYDLYRDIEMPLIKVLADMETEGVRVNGEELKIYGEKLSVRIDELEKIIYEKAGEEFNINSPKQLGVILFEKLGMPYGKKTKTGYSTAADVLEKLAPEYEIVAEILEYRQLTKLKSTYAEGLQNYIANDGRIHTTFNQTITATGRLSSTEPNLQNIPIRMELGRLIRKVFIPKDGCVLIDADYSQIELRILAHMSDDKNLIEAYKQDEDIHRITASKVFNVPFDEVTPLQRRNAKAVNFGIVYGISSFGLSQDLSISRKEAQSYIESYFETYPGIKAYLDNTVASAKELGYATTMYNRKRPITELSSSNFMQRQFGERIAMNTPIQGTAADIIKIAMIRVAERLEREGLKSKLILQVHDELLVEAYEDEKSQVETILSEEMKGAAELSVALEIGMESGYTWYDAH